LGASEEGDEAKDEDFALVFRLAGPGLRFFDDIVSDFAYLTLLASGLPRFGYFEVFCH
jgi:hypothetical protein